MIGRVHSIQTMGTVDGPGVRFVVFLQGCNMRCDYCHNPDTWSHDGAELLIDSAELAQRANRYRSYYGKTPGITVSGGEALCQQDFVIELFRECKRLGFHTALDTAGSVMAKPELLELTDLCLLDIKYTSEADYQKYTGGSLSKTLAFLQQLEGAQVDTVIRQVIVPGRNDTEAAMDALAELIREFRCVKKIELLPYRNLCIEKYDAMGIPFPLREMEQASPETVDYLQRYIDTSRQ